MPLKSGQQGEAIAASHLRAKGYEIIATNWRCAYGEIDLIAIKDDLLIFVEVKTRHAPTTESALASISAAKRRKIITAAHHYLNEHLGETGTDDALWRIDVVAIALRRNTPVAIDHVENAFDWD